MRIKLIGNPVSGGDARPRIQAALETLRDLGGEVDLCMTAARGDARQAASLAVSEGYDRVVAAGDSYNDTSMLMQADEGFLIHAPDRVKAEFPQFPALESYDQLLESLTRAIS